MASEYKRLHKKAVKKGWVVPSNSVFSDEAWMRYWSAMEEYEKDPSKGRPIPPHRSGGGMRLG